MNDMDIGIKMKMLQEETNFSGVYCANKGGCEFSGSFGFANRSGRIKNETKTKFGIASGCKIFTSIAICQLVEQGLLSFQSKLHECLDLEFPLISGEVNIHQLLTHTSGVPDYFDEEEMDDYEELWKDMPVYAIRTLSDFLPLFQDKDMVEQPGGAFYYNNAGYILLGLIVEKVSGLMFTDYVEKNIFKKAGMEASGYFEMDKLPENTAIGYIEESDGSYRTNVFSVPAKGGADGGAFVTAEDMVTFWYALFQYQLLSKEMTEKLLKPQIEVDEDLFYSYGGYVDMEQNKVKKHILMGYDPGVNFRSVYYPEKSISIVVCSNESDGAFEVLKDLERLLI
ncbi:serine hydrolase domain-containing protein [Oceanobacillus kapialis]|uniref:Serine hydrolase domain-containing protein n=1 Tax=Oceanobacillus kapialis TaxID=481353 RepID=A0ABW5PZU8_9BACI